jgi:phosphorylcholine metabolism protein LicD
VRATFPFIFDGLTKVYSSERTESMNLFEPQIRGLQSVRIESTEFMNTYSVHTSHQREARMSLRTDILDRINQLVRSSGLVIDFSFYDQQVTILIHSNSREKGLLDFSAFSPTGQQSVFESTLSMLNLLDSLVQTLKLYQN